MQTAYPSLLSPRDMLPVLASGVAGIGAANALLSWELSDYGLRPPAARPYRELN